MTFVAGFKCMDGVVLCADRLESDGVTKRYRCKLEGVNYDSEWGICWGCAGDGHVIDKFTDKFKGALNQLQAFNLAAIELAGEAALTLINQDYPGHLVQVMLAVWSGPIAISPRKIEAAKIVLYRGRSDLECLAPEVEYGLCGMDVTLAEFILRNASRKITVDEGIRLGVFATALMKKYAEGVDGQTDVRFYRRGQTRWEGPSPEEIRDIESSLQFDELERIVANWWRSRPSAPQT